MHDLEIAHHDFFKDRFRVSVSQAPGYEPKVWGLLLVAAGLFYLGYRIGRPLDQVGEAAERVSKAIEKVGDQLDKTLEKLNEILDAIKQLPEVLRGVVQEELVNQALSFARTQCSLIHDYTIDEATARANVDALQEAVDRLMEQVNYFRDQSGDKFASVYIMTPHITMWAQGHTLVQRIRQTNLTIWDTQFHQHNIQMFNTLFRDYAAMEPALKAIQTELADQNTTYEFRRSIFIASELPYDEEYTPQIGRSSLFIQRFYAGRDTLMSTLLKQGRWRWEPTIRLQGQPEPPWDDPQRVNEALIRFNRLPALRGEAQHVFDVMSDADFCQQRINECADKPPEWEGHSLSEKS